MKIKTPRDLETGLANGRDLLTETVDALGDTFGELDLKSRAAEGATDLLDAATTKDGRPKPATFAIGALVLVIVVLLVRRQSR